MSYWAVIPAAGVGARMGTERPKQYLPLRGKPVIEHCLDRLAAHPKVSGVVLALGQDDGYGAQFFSRPLWNGKPLHRVVGGAQRSHSVLNALVRLAEIAELDDWVLVHDAVRPCLRHADIDKLIATLEGHPVGGLLGVPVSDTIKRVAADHRAVETIARLELWRALTPQMFRLAALTRALTEAIERGIEVTDDAAAMSLSGAVPVMIEGHADNIKITHPADLALAEFYLTRQEESL
ncbi:MAG: 2-C-methyl-D-erythritol 4-phosphate cytidylyltransferase [Gammaproteobacteria bacterium]|nr:2-C-methyl-D-erythritol 4-phosphate cytidylyltransferase [Gammaproteobacteria bacterium]